MLNSKMGKFYKTRGQLCQQRVRSLSIFLSFFSSRGQWRFWFTIFFIRLFSHGRHGQSRVGANRGKNANKQIKQWWIYWPFQRLLQQRKTLGEPTGDVVDGPDALEFNKTAINSVSSPKALQTTKYLLAAREDGLVREENENRVVSREDTTELTEVEDVKHFGDFSDAVSLEL